MEELEHRVWLLEEQLKLLDEFAKITAGALSFHFGKQQEAADLVKKYAELKKDNT